MSDDNYESWTRPQLMEEAQAYGVKFQAKMSKGEMVKKLTELREAEAYQMAEANGEVKDDDDGIPRGARKVRIKIHKSDGPDGNNDVKVGLNGRAYVIKRDTQVDIPEPVFEACIKGAVFTVYEPVTNPVTGQIDIQERDVDRFAYTMYGYADQLGEKAPEREARPSMMKHNLR